MAANPCQPHGSGLKIRVRTETHTRYYYADALVVCSGGAPLDRFTETPTVIFEVLCDSTRRTDEQEKREGSFLLKSLKSLVLVSQEEPMVWVWRRSDAGMARESFAGLSAVVPLPEIGIGIPRLEIYRRISFGESTETPAGNAL